MSDRNLPANLEVYSPLGGSILFLCTITCVSGNIIALKYFLAHRKTPSALSYIFISFNDLTTLVLLLPLELSLFTGTGYLRSPTGCSVWTFVWSISRRMTNFLVMWILACRIVTLMYQFKYLRAANIYIPTICYLVVLLIQGIVPIAVGGYTVESCDLTSSNSVFKTNSTVFKAAYFTVDVLEFALPIVADKFMVVSALVFIKSGTGFFAVFIEKQSI